MHMSHRDFDNKRIAKWKRRSAADPFIWLSSQPRLCQSSAASNTSTYPLPNYHLHHQLISRSKRSPETPLVQYLLSSPRTIWQSSLKRRSCNARLQSYQVYPSSLLVLAFPFIKTVVFLVERINRTAASNASRSYPAQHQTRHTPYPGKWHAPVAAARASSTQAPGKRNRSLVLDNRNKSSSTPPTALSTALPVSQTSTLHAGAAPFTPAVASTSNTPITTPVIASAHPSTIATADVVPKTNYVHHTTKKGNMSLVKPEIYGKL
jgi:hypothetical protein